MGSASNRESVAWSSTLLSRPSGGIAESIGARQVSWLAAYRRRRLPRLMKKPSGEKSVGTLLTVAGAATDRQEAYRVPFSPSGVIEGPCLGLCPSFERGCQMERNVVARSEAGSPRSRFEAYVGEAPSIEKTPARTSAGSSSSGLGGEPRGPSNVRSSHNAVILASATTGLRVGTPFSASAGRLSSPNSVSANRRSISCCSRARAS
jgi:hypothetical protein